MFSVPVAPYCRVSGDSRISRPVGELQGRGVGSNWVVYEGGERPSGQTGRGDRHVIFEIVAGVSYGQHVQDNSVGISRHQWDRPLDVPQIARNQSHDLHGFGGNRKVGN
jgi:hypothetical protein